MPATPDLHLSLVIRADRPSGLDATLASLGGVPRVERSRLQIVIVRPDREPAVAASVEAFVAEAAFPAIEVVSGDWSNAASAWNAAMAVVRGVWVLRLESGDELISDPFPFLDRQPAATAVMFSVELITRANARRGRRIHPRRLDADRALRILTAHNPLLAGAIIYRRAFATHPFDEELDHLHEWCFWMLNRGIFERAAVERKVLLTRLRRTPTLLSHRDAGADRVRIATRLANRLRFRLGRKRTNNLHLHKVCGLRQQGQRAPFVRTLWRIPADLVLYLRTLMFLLLGRAAARR